MKRLFGVFVLTPREQRLIIFIMLVMVAAAWIKHQRESHLNATTPALPAATPSFSPNE